MQEIDVYLGLPGRPDDDLKDLEEARIDGSCKWFTGREGFQRWVNSESVTSSKIYWIHAKPATGKSVLSGYIINTLSSLNLDCSYYFFRHGDKERSTVSGLLRSMIFQMALISVNVRQKLLSMIERGIRFDKDDAKAVWRKVVVPSISQVDPFQTQYWILDALDECSDFNLLFPMMASIEPTTSIKILITSRKMPEIVQQFADLQRNSNGEAVIYDEMSFDDTQADINLYLEGNRTKLHAGSDAERDVFLNRVLEKSEGCFLWVRLVLDELALAWTVSQIEQVLEEVPQNMEQLYARALSIMSSKPKYTKNIARAILTWTVCAVRPLTITELHTALRIDLDDDVHDLESAIASLCAQLVHVDKTGRVLMVHLTARTFLVNPELESEFCINEKLGHLRLAKICLQYLCSDEMELPRARRAKRVQTRRKQRSDFVFYVCPAFAEHLRRTTSKDRVLSMLLYNFLDSNVLSWIEHVASTGNLFVLTRTANSIKAYLQRHIQCSSPLGEFTQLVESWAIDLHRIVAKFGSHLLSSPSAIYWLIPPFCPASSAIASSFRSSSRRIVVKGLTDTGWDDRLSSINSHDKQASSVACGEAFFAIGYFLGNIVLHHNTTCQEWKTLEHGGPVRHLRFNSTSTTLVSSSKRDIRVWDIESGFILWIFATSHDILDFTFLDKDRALMAATRCNFAHSWSLQSGRDMGKTDWTESLPFHDEGQFRRPPLAVAFSPDESLIAIVYRGRSICLYDVEENELHGLIGRERDPTALALGTNTSPSSLVFNTNKAIPLLAAAYEDGDLCLFDYEELKLLKILEANAQIVACSPDGLTLATGNSAGMVQLMEFETLQLLYQVNAIDYGIRYIAFSADNLCFLDVRGTQCNVWEPPVLSGLNIRDEMSTDAAAFQPVIKGISDGELEITKIMLEDTGAYFFIGRSDGTVCIYGTEDGMQRRILYRHTYQIPVTSMDWGSRKNIIATADAASRFIVCALKRDDSTGWALSAKLMDIRANSAILGVLLNPTNDLLLVSASELNTVWDIANKKQLSSKEPNRNTSSTWMNHPLNGQHRILVALNTATVVDWESSSTVVPSDLLQLPEGVLFSPCQGVKNAISFAGGHLVAVELSELYGERSTTQMLVFKSENFAPEVTGLIPLLDHQAIGKEVMHLIGAYGSKLIFLNKSCWVCSIDMEQTECKSYIRHFPIPSDWQSQQRVLRMEVTGKGDILFVRTEEVAVIKRGLEFEESVVLDSR
jgi:WD40 repeat protein